MGCRVCLSASRRLLNKPTSSRIGARVFSQYLSLSTVTTPPRCSYLRDSTIAHVKLPNISNIGRRHVTSTRRHDGTSRWTELGISPSIAERLITSYPHTIQPTPAQKLFLLSVSAGKEVLLKDDMGRGKTLALALSALNIASRSDRGKGVKAMIIVPTPHLALQTTAHLTNLSSANSDEANAHFTLLRPISPTTSSKEGSTPSTKISLPNTSIIISTPKDLLSYDLDKSSLKSLRYIYLDEPDTMIGSIPSRSSTPEMVRNHTLFKHPPPIIPIMNKLLNIKPGKYSDGGGNSDFSERRNEVNTIWISSTLNKDFKRLIKTRGWIKRGKDYLVDLDFTRGASDKLREVRDRLLVAVERMRAKQEMGIDDQSPKENHMQIKPDHYALVIDPKDGSISSLDPNSPSSYIPPSKNKNDSADIGNSTMVVMEKREIPIEMIESLSLIHAISSSSNNDNNGRYSLILPPEGISLVKLSEELSNLGISSLILNPEVVQLGLDPSTFSNSDSNSEGTSDIPILLASRSSITGLHLPQLDTIYLLDGLDIRGLSKQQRKSGGVKDRYAFYELVSGRLGRLGTPGFTGEKQRVISLVMDGSEDEKRLKEMFGNEDNGMVLREWDVRGMERALEDELGVEEGEEADVNHYEDENDLEGYEGEGGKEDTTERQ